MKNLLILALLLIGFVNTTLGQKNTYGISIGTGGGMIMNEALEGAPSYDLNTSLSIGLQYSRKLTNALHLVTGIHWYNNKVTVTPHFHPGMDMTPKNHDIQLLYVPISLKVDFAKHFFITGGLLIDVDVTKNSYITSQSGLGTGLGIGGEFPIKDKFLIQINPYLNFHGLLMTASENYPERVLDSGVKLNFVIRR